MIYGVIYKPKLTILNSPEGTKLDFWWVIHIEVSLILGDSLEFTPVCYLLYLCTHNKKVTFVSNLLVAAKLLIAKNWKSDLVPTKGDWQVKLSVLVAYE